MEENTINNSNELEPTEKQQFAAREFLAMTRKFISDVVNELSAHREKLSAEETDQYLNRVATNVTQKLTILGMFGLITDEQGKFLASDLTAYFNLLIKEKLQ